MSSTASMKFQSHEPEFDYQEPEIEERINKIRWCKGRRGCSSSLTNDKTTAVEDLRRKCAWSRLGPLHLVRVRLGL